LHLLAYARQAEYNVNNEDRIKPKSRYIQGYRLKEKAGMK
jgi:hypothetical protein